jgi:hypothetical protein
MEAAAWWLMSKSSSVELMRALAPACSLRSTRQGAFCAIGLASLAFLNRTPSAGVPAVGGGPKTIGVGAA